MPNTPHSYNSAVKRYKMAHENALSEAHQDLNLSQNVIFTRINDKAMSRIQDYWIATKLRKVNWDWSKPLYRNFKSFSLAIWSDDQLCGLAAGRARAQKSASIQLMEGAPDNHPVKGEVMAIALMCLERYASHIGAMEMRLMQAVPTLIPTYQELGFCLAPQLGHPRDMRRLMK